MPHDITGISYYTIPNFHFVGGTVKDVRVAYRSFNPTSAKGTVLIPTCYMGRINSTLNFTDGTLKDYHVVVVAMLGNGESTSPSNDEEFPKDYSLRYQDCINSQHALLTQHLHVPHLTAVLGFSMGGQQAYHWACTHGTGPSPYLSHAIVICGSARTSGHNYAFLEGPIAALTCSSDYAGGTYKDNDRNAKPRKGLRAFGRAYAAWLTSAEWFRQELWRDLGAKSLVEWLDPVVSPHEEWDPEDLLVLARMWQAGDVGVLVNNKDENGKPDYRAALSAVTARVLVMPSATDQYFPPEDGEQEVKYLKNGVFEPIPTVWGHIAGGGANPVDTEWMDGRIARFLEGV